MNPINLALRGVQFLWTLLILALTGNMIAESYAGNPSIINYIMFCAVFAMLSLVYLTAASVKEGLAGHPLIMVAVDALNTLFFFCAAVALAAGLDVHKCSNQGYVLTNGITNGSHDPTKRCREAQAVDAFLWFGFASFAASIGLDLITSTGGSSLGRGGIGGIRRGGPSMSQV